MATDIGLTNMVQPDIDAMHAKQVELEQMRLDSQASSNTLHNRLELLRHAKEILLANRNNAPVGEREVTDDEIVKYATTLEAFINK